MQIKKEIVFLILIFVSLTAIFFVNQRQELNKDSLIVKTPFKYEVNTQCSDDSDCIIRYGYDGTKCLNCGPCGEYAPEDESTIVINKFWAEDCPPKDPMMLCLACAGHVNIINYTAEAKCIRNTCHKVLNKVNYP